MDNLQWIEKYLRGQMNRAEEEQFRQRIRTQPAFKNEVLVHTLMIKAIHNAGQRSDEQVKRSVMHHLTWKKYILVYGVYSHYYFTDNLNRYNLIFSHGSSPLLQ